MHKIVSSVPYERSGKFARGIQFMVRRISILEHSHPIQMWQISNLPLSFHQSRIFFSENHKIGNSFEMFAILKLFDC